MAIAQGKDSKIVVVSTTVAKLNSLSISFSNNSEETRYFQEDGSSFTKTGESCTIACSGHLVGGAGDTGQNLIVTAAFSDAATISGIKFYEEDTGYWWEADTSSNADSTFMVDNLEIGSEAGSFVTFSANFNCSGDVKRVNS